MQLMRANCRSVSAADGRIMELRGYPAPAFVRKITDNKTVAQRLWQESERLTGVRYLND